MCFQKCHNQSFEPKIYLVPSTENLVGRIVLILKLFILISKMFSLLLEEKFGMRLIEDRNKSEADINRVAYP